jgi:hypothetical protein
VSGPQAQSWRRGDLVARDGEPGFVVEDLKHQDEFLLVRWQHRGIQKTHRGDIHLIRRFNEAEEQAALHAAGRTPLQSLEALEALERIEKATKERSKTIRNAREQRTVDTLIRRAFAEPAECDWDKKNSNLLGMLALKPHDVGWLFKLREYLHRPVHRVFHHRA